MFTKVFSLEYSYFLVCDWVIIQHVYKVKYLQDILHLQRFRYFLSHRKRNTIKLLHFSIILVTNRLFIFLFFLAEYKSICNKSFQLLYLSTFHYQTPIQLFIHSVIIVDIFLQSVDIAQMIIIVFQNSETIQDITLISA